MSVLRDCLNATDYEVAIRILGGDREPDLNIAPDRSPYLYRWHVIPRAREANVYMHLQVASDPERPLHDHPWDNQSVILAGGYDEVIGRYSHLTGWNPFHNKVVTEQRRKGDTYARSAEAPHRLILPPTFPYMLTLFSTGPTRRNWGFWCPSGGHERGQWREHQKCVKTLPDGRSVWMGDQEDLEP